jgi:hypothetical protein
MKTLYAHIGTKPSTISRAIVCAQRPLCGDITWEGDSIGNGVYYASGDMSEYGAKWEGLDASIVTYLTDSDILASIRDNLKRDGIAPENAQRLPITKVCDIYRLPHVVCEEVSI